MVYGAGVEDIVVIQQEQKFRAVLQGKVDAGFETAGGAEVAFQPVDMRPAAVTGGEQSGDVVRRGVVDDQGVGDALVPRGVQRLGEEVGAFAVGNGDGGDVHGGTARLTRRGRRCWMMSEGRMMAAQTRLMASSSALKAQ